MWEKNSLTEQLYYYYRVKFNICYAIIHIFQQFVYTDYIIRL